MQKVSLFFLSLFLFPLSLSLSLSTLFLENSLLLSRTQGKKTNRTNSERRTQQGFGNILLLSKSLNLFLSFFLRLSPFLFSLNLFWPLKDHSPSKQKRFVDEDDDEIKLLSENDGLLDAHHGSYMVCIFFLSLS